MPPCLLYQRLCQHLRGCVPQLGVWPTRRLSLLVTGLLLARHTALPRVAAQLRRVTPSAHADSIERRLRRTLAHTRWDASVVFEPVVRACLRQLPAGRCVLLLDDTQQTDRCTVSTIALAYAGRALPLAWCRWSGQLHGTYWLQIARLFERAQRVLRPQVEPVLLADRGFGVTRLGAFDPAVWLGLPAARPGAPGTRSHGCWSAISIGAPTWWSCTHSGCTSRPYFGIPKAVASSGSSVACSARNGPSDCCWQSCWGHRASRGGWRAARSVRPGQAAIDQRYAAAAVDERCTAANECHARANPRVTREPHAPPSGRGSRSARPGSRGGQGGSSDSPRQRQSDGRRASCGACASLSGRLASLTKSASGG
jgi:hypothetical protein